MPDITMCESKTCTVRETCYRNPESGTKPSEWRQSWFLAKDGDYTKGPNTDDVCDYFWPKVVKS